jgi:hypothetical protein
LKDQTGHLTQVPKLPSNARVEVCFIIREQDLNSKPKSKPHADIIEKSQILGDVFISVPESDWNLPEWRFLICISDCGG